jgi:xanthine dehydrogenase accessory factor
VVTELAAIHDAVRRVLKRKGRGLLVTVVATRGSTYRRAGARSVIGDDGEITGAISGGCVERDLALRAKGWTLDFTPRVITYDSSGPEDVVFGLGLGCRGEIDMVVQPFDAAHPPALPPLPQREPIVWRTVVDGRELLVETLEPQRAIVVFGGTDAQPVAAIAQAIGWRTDVFSGVDVPALGNYDAIVIMTHNFLRDVALLEAAFASPARYIGLLGPKSRGAELLTQVGAADARLHNPIGLDLGGETPAEIALSIVAEIQSVLTGGTAEALREKDSPIHAMP